MSVANIITKMILICICVFFLLIVGSCGGGGSVRGIMLPPQVPQNDLPLVQVQNKKIVTEDGGEMFFRGINFGCWLLWEGGALELPNDPEHKLRQELEERMTISEVDQFFDLIKSNYITEEDFSNAKTLGLNYVRLPFHHRYVDSQQLTELDDAITWAKNAGIYIMLDMQAAPGSQNTAYHSDSDGNAYLWENASYQDDFVSLWETIAQRYKDETTVLGYELLNEPEAPTSTELTSLYQRAITAIRVIDTNHIIFLDGNDYASDFTGFNPLQLGDNIVYVFHSYDSVQDTSDNWQQYEEFQDQYEVPVICNEYGGDEETELTTFFQTQNIPYAPWGYKLSFNTPDKTPFYYIDTDHIWRTQFLNEISSQVEDSSEQKKNEMLTALNQSSLSDQCKQDLIDLLNNQGRLTSADFRTASQNYPGDATELDSLSLQFGEIELSYMVDAIVSIFQSMNETEKSQLMNSLKTQYWEKGTVDW